MITKIKLLAEVFHIKENQIKKIKSNSFVFVKLLKLLILDFSWLS